MIAIINNGVQYEKKTMQGDRQCAAFLPKPSLCERFERVREGLFFIVGCGRSGTSLLQSMIASHPGVSIPPETGFYPLIRDRHYSKWGELGDEQTFKKALDETLSFWRISGLDLDRKMIEEAAKCGPPRWETILLAVLTVYSDKMNVSRVGEKSPSHVRYLGLLNERFPQARFLHVVRDPRAVALSYRTLKVRFGRRFVSDVCRQWKDAVLAHQSFAGAIGPDRYRVVRYEDLINGPEKTLREVCSFLGLKYSQDMLEYHRRTDPGFHKAQSEHMTNTMKPVFTSSIDKWKTQLTQRQIGIVERLLKEQMAQMGYPSSGAGKQVGNVAVTLDILGSLKERSLKKLGSWFGGKDER